MSLTFFFFFLFFSFFCSCAGARQVARSKSSGPFFSIAAREHPKSRMLVAVQGERRLVWWSSSAASLEESEGFDFDARIMFVLDHKKFVEVVVVLADGRVQLFNLATKQIVSHIGEPKAQLDTIWSGVYSLSKIAHVLLVVYDREKATNYLRVIRLTNKKVEEKDSCVLEHVCVHVLVPPTAVAPAAAPLNGSKKSKNQRKGSAVVSASRNVVLNATFDVSGLVLSCMWSAGVFASYFFGRTKNLASLDVNVPPRECSSKLSVPMDLVSSTHFVAFRQNHVCFALNGTVVLYNTLHGTTVSEPQQVPIDKGEQVIAFVAASNDSFFMLATRTQLFRVTVSEPESSSLVHSLDSHGQLERIFGPQPSASSSSSSIDFSFSVTSDGRGVVVSEAPVQIPSTAEALGELLAARCTLGVGSVLRAGAKKTAKENSKDAWDIYSVSPEFGAAAVSAYVERGDWASVKKILDAKVFSFPPKGLVETAVAQRQTSVLLSVVENYPALAQDELTRVIAFALGPSYEQEATGFSNALLQAVVARQRSSFVLSLEPAELQAFFVVLVSMFRSFGVLSDVSGAVALPSILDWMNCVVDSKPLAFSFDPKMAELVSQMLLEVKSQIHQTKTLNEIGIALDVIKNNQIPATVASSSAQNYSIEFLSFD